MMTFTCRSLLSINVWRTRPRMRGDHDLNELVGHLQVAEARARTYWSENGWASWRRPQHLGEVEHQIRAIFSLARRSCSSMSSFSVGQRGWMGSDFLGAAFIQGRELHA